MYMLADFGNPLNKRLKRAFQRGLYPSDDAITAVQKARGRKPTEVIADALSDRISLPIERNDPPSLTKRVIGTLKSIRESPVEINQTLYANSKTGTVPKSKLNKKLRTMGNETSVAANYLPVNKTTKYDTVVSIHNHPLNWATPSGADIKSSLLMKDKNMKRSKDYIVGQYGFDITKTETNPTIKQKKINKYNRDIMKQVVKENPELEADDIATMERKYNERTKRLKERNKKLFNSYEKYGI